jgi:hypothetical protein
MNCNNAQQDMYRFIGGDLPHNIAKNLVDHLDSCQSCVMCLEDMKATKSFFQKLSTPSLSGDFNEKLQRKISELEPQTVTQAEVVAFVVEEPVNPKLTESKVGYFRYQALAASVALFAILILVIVGQQPIQIDNKQFDLVTESLLLESPNKFDEDFIKYTQMAQQEDMVCYDLDVAYSCDDLDLLLLL